jgi:cation:H+ antiporter
MIAVLWCMAGLAALIVGAEVLTRFGTRLAALVGVPPIIIGLTIVAIGTSAPELAVGIDAALQGSGSLSVGNIAGTNTFNILFILGVSAVLWPLSLELRAIRFDLPVMTAAAAALMLMSLDGLLSRTEGVILVAGAIVYTLGIIRDARRESRAVKAEFAGQYPTPATRNALNAVASSFAALVAGIAVVVVGARWLVDGAVDLARMLGVSQAFIGLTVVAIGTSSPELVTTVVSTLRQQRDVAVGNLIGSSTYNILFILGVTALVPADGIAIEPALIYIDIPIMGLVAVACIPVFVSGREVSRREGAFFVGCYLWYLAYLLLVRA